MKQWDHLMPAPLGMAEHVPIRSVLQRSHALAREAARWIEVSAVHEFSERLRDSVQVGVSNAHWSTARASVA